MRGSGQAWEDQKSEDQGEGQGERGRATVNVRGQNVRGGERVAEGHGQRIRGGERTFSVRGSG